MKSMVELAHMFLKPALHKQAVCIDATLGQGKDAAYFFKHGAKKVYGFEIQEEVLENTLSVLNNPKLIGILDSHANLKEHIGPGLLEGIDAIVFNFGYYPKYGPGIETQADTSLAAVQSALAYLKVKGRMALVFYGHEQGRKEARQIEDWLLKQDPHVLAMQKIVQMNADTAPFLICIEKKKSVK
jgi:hypothetical protein